MRTHIAFALALLLCPALAGPTAAQWSSLAYNSAKPITHRKWFVAHDPGTGVQAFSAIAQQWTPVSGASATQIYTCESALVMDEGGGVLRGWSAYTNSSSTQAVSALFTIKSAGVLDCSYCLLVDSGVVPPALRAYSAYTGTWSSVALTNSAGNSSYGANVAIVQDGFHWRAYSAYTGQWVTFDAPSAPVQFPLAGSEYAAIDLGTPKQYAAFSAQRGKWTLSPLYPASGAAPIPSGSSASAAFAIRADTGNASTRVYAGYSGLTGQWSTSTLVHSTTTSQAVTASANLVRVQDTDTAARYEVFGAGNGVWQSLTGPNLVEDSLHQDFQLVKSTTTNPTTFYAVSGLVGGGYTSISVPMFSAVATPSTHGCVVYVLVSGGAWAYSAATNAFLPQLAFPGLAFPMIFGLESVYAFVLQGTGSIGTKAKAYSARWGQWVDGPTVDGTAGWSCDAKGNTVVVTHNLPTVPASYEFTPFDEHSNQWLASPVIGTDYAFCPNAFVAYTPSTGVFQAYSAQRGDWSTQTGVGAVVGGSSQISSSEYMVSFTDTNGTLWVFATPDSTQSWFPWPIGKQYAVSGATPGGTTPYIGLSVHGNPGTDYALVYANAALAPAPLAIPGFGGLLDLELSGAFLLANLGLVDADGVREARIPISGTLPSNTQAWMQAILLDLSNGQARFAGRATGARFY
jgi:hypothetical protein